MSREIEQLTNQIMILLAGGAGGLIAFWAISIFLANLALRPVEKAWEQQKRFVADASHELRTPLTVILANIGILLSHRKDTIEKQYKWVENTQAEASRMKKLVDDLLFLAKLDAVQKPVQQTELNFSDIVWSSLLPFEPIAYEQGIEVSSEIDPDISLNGDAGQLKQLVAILLDNACKYAGQNGKVTLTLKTIRIKLSSQLTIPGSLSLSNIWNMFSNVFTGPTVPESANRAVMVWGFPLPRLLSRAMEGGSPRKAMDRTVRHLS